MKFETNSLSESASENAERQLAHSDVQANIEKMCVERISETKDMPRATRKTKKTNEENKNKDLLRKVV